MRVYSVSPFLDDRSDEKLKSVRSDIKMCLSINKEETITDKMALAYDTAFFWYRTIAETKSEDPEILNEYHY